MEFGELTGEKLPYHQVRIHLENDFDAKCRRWSGSKILLEKGGCWPRTMPKPTLIVLIIGGRKDIPTTGKPFEAI